MTRIGVLRVGEDVLGRPGLDNLALGHHAHPVGDLAHDAKVVGDEQHRHALAALQSGQQFEDLRLHGDVERGRWFVGDQQFRLVGQRHGDHDALALAARKLVRIGVEPLLRIADADLLEQGKRTGLGRAVGHALMQLQDFDDLVLDRVQRIERGHRLLEDHGDLVAAHLAQLLFAHGQQVGALEQDLAGGMAGAGVGQKLQHRQRRDRFAGAGFTDQRHGLALGDIEGDVVDRDRLAAALAEGDAEVLDAEQGRFAHLNVLRGSKASRVASPTKTSSDSISEMTTNPDMPSQGALRLRCACFSNSPSEAEPGGRPKPR